MHEATVTSVNQETPDSVCVTLKVPEQSKPKFTYTQGQNLTLIKEIGGNEVRRSYSICSSVADETLRIGIKRVPDGVFSTWATTELVVGDRVSLLPPSGSFFVELDPGLARNHVGVAAGSGITPILSILKTTLETEPMSTFTLLYGNKSANTVMFLEELAALKNVYPERFQLFHILSREVQDSELLSGRITGEKILEFVDRVLPAAEIDEVFLCGPHEMVTSAHDAFAQAGVQTTSIHTELFFVQTSAVEAQRLPQNGSASTIEEKTSSVAIVLDGTRSELSLAQDGQSILDAALEAGRDLPFACKGGVCATCKATVIEGEVRMDLNYSLSDEEVLQGAILTCQAHPTSDRVLVDFDQK